MPHLSVACGCQRAGEHRSENNGVGARMHVLLSSTLRRPTPLAWPLRSSIRQSRRAFSFLYDQDQDQDQPSTPRGRMHPHPPRLMPRQARILRVTRPDRQRGLPSRVQFQSLAPETHRSPDQLACARSQSRSRSAARCAAQAGRGRLGSRCAASWHGATANSVCLPVYPLT